MGHTVIYATIYAPLITVGLVLVTMWGMSNAGSDRKGFGRTESDQVQSGEI